MQFTSTQKRAASWLLIAVVTALILWKLGAVLTPFLIAAVMAYVLNPLVNRLVKLGKGRISRPVAAALVEAIALLLVIGVLMLVVPVFVTSLPQISAQLPEMIDKSTEWLQTMLNRYGVNVQVSMGSLKEWVQGYFKSGDATSTVGSVLNSLKMGGSLALSVLGNAMLVPLALYYLLVDWDRLVEALYALVPVRMRESVTTFANEADQILGQYLRGEMLVMVILSLFYSIGMMLFGFDMAWPIGIFTGLLVFVPYLGFSIGLVMAALFGIIQLGLTKAAIMVAVVYGAGQLLESFYLTPRLVGESIGLHPLVAIFALLAFGQLFGFVGVLIALPASAVLQVALRRLKVQYLNSPLYKG